MADFGFIHGGMHGAWCWTYVALELRALGHRPFAVDLPIETVGLGAVDYAHAAATAFAEADDDLIVVAHSLGGLTAPLLPALRPVGTIVYLCAALPEFSRSFRDQILAGGIMTPRMFEVRAQDSLGRTAMTQAHANEVWFDDCEPDIQRWAFRHLRPQAQHVQAENTPLEAWPDVPVHSIVCTEDRAVNLSWGRDVARTRLGVEAIELPGGHSPFLSRPAELAALLDGLTR
jgi:pimeloyl-ACP methyl ester carboxylesterase